MDPSSIITQVSPDEQRPLNSTAASEKGFSTLGVVQQFFPFHTIGLSLFAVLGVGKTHYRQFPRQKQREGAKNKRKCLKYIYENIKAKSPLAISLVSRDIENCYLLSGDNLCACAVAQLTWVKTIGGVSLRQPIYLARCAYITSNYLYCLLCLH